MHIITCRTSKQLPLTQPTYRVEDKSCVVSGYASHRCLETTVELSEVRVTLGQ